MVTADYGGEILKRALALAVWIWLSLAGLPAAHAAEDLRAEHSMDLSENGASSSGHSTAIDGQAKKEALTLGFIMLGCIIVGGTILLALVVMWGNRTRRLARSPLPPVAQRDELWFLKAKKELGLPERTAGDPPGSNIEPETK